MDVSTSPALALAAGLELELSLDRRQAVGGDGGGTGSLLPSPALLPWLQAGLGGQGARGASGVGLAPTPATGRMSFGRPPAD